MPNDQVLTIVSNYVLFNYINWVWYFWTDPVLILFFTDCNDSLNTEDCAECKKRLEMLNTNIKGSSK